MTFEDAFDKAVRAFYEGGKLSEYEKVSGKPSRYTQDYFQSIQDEMVKSKPKKK